MSVPGVDALPDLPVVAVLPELRAALRDGSSAVLVGPPGAGKTTLVPLALLDEPWLDGDRIVMLEPRRLATRAAADRMADLLGEEGAGDTVGYRIRMDTRVGPDTRIEVVTEGVLTRMLQSDPGLAGVGMVIFDEFHERSLPADLGLALALQCHELFRDDLRIAVMSATLDAAPVAALLGGAPVVEAEGRRYAVETRYRKRPVEGWIEPPVARTVLRALERDEGDVLVFLPGAGEIRRTAERLRGEDAGALHDAPVGVNAKGDDDGGPLPADVDLYPLFGNLPRAEQDRAIAPSPEGRRKVVLATSIAETSLTIEGVRVVVDSGRMRIPRFDPGTGMTRLETVRVTRDAADQRRGRAGRTAPGVCYRLWTKGQQNGLVPHRRPEILEADLAPLALDLAVWGAAPDELHWLDPPPTSAYEQARELLRELEALDTAGEVTDHGRQMAEIGLHPRLAHMLIRGLDLGLGTVACDLAALLGERDVLRGEGRAPDADLRLRSEAMRRAREGPGLPDAVRGQRVARGRLERTLREARHWRRLLGIPADAQGPAEEIEEVGILAALAYPDRIGRRREGGRRERGRYLLRNGRGAAFEEAQPLAGSEWLVAAEVQGGGADARIFRAAPLALEEVETHFSHQIEEVEEVVWDPGEGRVVARRRRKLGALVLQESPLREPDADTVGRALLEGIREAGLRALPWTKHIRQLRNRVQFLHGVDPDTWPDMSDEALQESLESWLLPYVGDASSLDDLQRIDLAEALRSRVGWEKRQLLDELAPSRIRVPSGSEIRVDYSDTDSPALAVRIQEVFGWTETPRIAGGRVPVTLKLLSPAHRPAQVTTDLASFWERTYFEVKKELQGRYPKHYWPDDPLTAPATRGTKPGD